MSKRKRGKARTPGRRKPRAAPSKHSAKEAAASRPSKPGGGRRHPMPCPGCRKMIDATDHLCPHCGIDTDAKLWPFRAALPFVAVALVVGIGALFKALPPSFAFGIVAGTAAVVVVAILRRRR